VELYLSHNGIWALDSGLSKLTGLKVRYPTWLVPHGSLFALAVSLYIVWLLGG
jgi:hypothetical protein